MQDDSWDSDASSCDKPRTQVFVRADIRSARARRRAHPVPITCAFSALLHRPRLWHRTMMTSGRMTRSFRPIRSSRQGGLFLFRLRLMPSSRPYCPTHPSSSRKRECEMRSAKCEAARVGMLLFHKEPGARTTPEGEISCASLLMNVRSNRVLQTTGRSSQAKQQGEAARQDSQTMPMPDFIRTGRWALQAGLG